MARILLVYYTGTFNTRFLSKRIKERMEKDGDSVDLYEIDPLNNERLDFRCYDLVGLGAPIYGFAAPRPFLKFVKRQKFPKGLRVFIYKDSGETYPDNDASSMFVMRKLRRSKVDMRNEYHFGMPYNIHFRFDEDFVREQLVMNDKLIDIMLFELRHGIGNLRPCSLRSKLITSIVAPWQYIGGDVNSFLYKVDKSRCIDCDKCIKGCPMQNIYRDRKGDIRFHHHCNMCMRCSMFCPKDAIHIGFLDDWGWKVNGAYDFKKIESREYRPVIDGNTEGFFQCYRDYFLRIGKRHSELFGGEAPIAECSHKKSLGMVARLLRAAFTKTDIRDVK